MDVLLAVQPGRPELSRAVICLRVLRTPKPPLPCVPFVRELHVGDLHVHVVDAHDVGAAIEVETLQLPFHVIDLVIELDGQPGGILHTQRLPLPLLFARLDPAHRSAPRNAVAVETLQIVRRRNPEGEMRNAGGRRLAQHQAMVVALFQATQVYACAVAARVHEPQQVDVEGPGLPQICDTVLDVSQTEDLHTSLATVHERLARACSRARN